MSRRIVWVIVVLMILTGGFLLWKRRNAAQELSSGDVHCVGCMTPEEHARFVKENAGDTEDGASDRENRTAAQESATDFQDDTPATATPRATGSPAASKGSDGMRTSGARAEFAPTNRPSLTSSDTLAPNAPEGARVAGSGPYQWYRQGNLTWRVDTVTGRSCIVYATLEEWRKAIVLSHGCGRSA